MDRDRIKYGASDTRCAKLACDRIAVAAHAQWPGDLIIIDFGTATTFDVVSAAGDYEGGVISPGINLSMDALYQAAAKLPRIAKRFDTLDADGDGKLSPDEMRAAGQKMAARRTR